MNVESTTCLLASFTNALGDLKVSTEILLFILVGAVATVIDFGVFNWLTRRPMSWIPLLANLVSSGAGLVFKFVMNWHFVFQTQNLELFECFVAFLLVNSISAFGIQSLVILLCTRYGLPPVNLSGLVAIRLGSSREMVARNATKCAAIVCGLIWNFAWCKWFVFR